MEQKFNTSFMENELALMNFEISRARESTFDRADCYYKPSITHSISHTSITSAEH